MPDRHLNTETGSWRDSKLLAICEFAIVGRTLCSRHSTSHLLQQDTLPLHAGIGSRCVFEEWGTLFGFGHSYQGITGQVENIIDGLLLGLLYLACGRNLWAPIIAHGITDTIDIMLMYLGKYPGM